MGEPSCCELSFRFREFLLGPQLANNLINLGIYDEVREAVKESGGDWGALLIRNLSPVWETAV